MKIKKPARARENNKMSNNRQQHHVDLGHPLEEAEPFLERLLFSKRPLVMLLFIAVTILLAFQAIKVRPDASFEKMIPTGHPFVANFLEDRNDLKGLGNVIRISV